MKRRIMKGSIGWILLAFAGYLLVLPELACSAQDISKLKETLLGPGEGHDGLLQVPRKGEARLEAIQGLAQIGSREALDILLAFLTAPGSEAKLKQEALVALGKIGAENPTGGEYAVEAIGKFEAWAEARRKTEPVLRLGRQDAAMAHHFSGHTVAPIAKCKDTAGIEWALVQGRQYGQLDAWLVQVKDGAAVGQPILLDLPVGSNPQAFGEIIRKKAIRLAFGAAPGSFTVDLAGEQFPFMIDEAKKDSDSDGLTDIQEQRMATDPAKPDTDGDGAKDSEDPAPLTPKLTILDDAAQIRQAVFTLYFATTNSRDALLMVGDKPFAQQEFQGYLGPLLRIQEAATGANNITDLDVVKVEGDAATAQFSDYEAPLAASGNTITLRKAHGRWVVIKFEMDWIS